MATYLWPGDDGWPIPEEEEAVLDVVDLDAEPDLDALSLHAPPPHLYDELTPIERAVIVRRFGLDGRAPRSMKELQTELGRPRHDVRDALASGLEKLRAHLVS